MIKIQERLLPIARVNLFGKIDELIRPDDYEALGITAEDYRKKKHAAYVERGQYILAEIRTGETVNLVPLVKEIAFCVYTLPEIDLPEKEFRGYAETVVLSIASETVKSVTDSRNLIATICVSAMIYKEDAVHNKLQEILEDMPKIYSPI
jgi:hypothetical protein